MIADEGSINHLLNEQDALTILVDALLHDSIIVKRNAAESLAFLIKDDNTRTNINNDRILHVSLNEY
jgi:hypothetical protein